MPDTSLSGRSTLTARRVRKSKLPGPESLGALGIMVIILSRKRVNVCEKNTGRRGSHCQQCVLMYDSDNDNDSDREHAVSWRHLL